MANRPRDSQRSKVTAALRLVEQMCTATDPVEAGDELIEKIRASRYWKGRGGNPSRVPRFREYSRITALSLCAVPLAPANETRPHHSPAFCLAVLDLAKRFAPDLHQPLRDAFKAHKVKTRTISPEAREAAKVRWLERQQSKLEPDLRALQEKLAAMSQT